MQFNTQQERELLLQELKKSVSLQIELWDSINRLEELIDFRFDAASWVQAAATDVCTANDLKDKDVDDFLSSRDSIDQRDA
jgi:hypothetical protein